MHHLSLGTSTCHESTRFLSLREGASCLFLVQRNNSWGCRSDRNVGRSCIALCVDCRDARTVTWLRWRSGKTVFVVFEPLKTNTNVQVLLYLVLPEFRKRIAFGSFLSSPFFLLVRATCRWRRLWSAVGMILTGETEVQRVKPVPVSLCPPQIPH